MTKIHRSRGKLTVFLHSIFALSSFIVIHRSAAIEVQEKMNNGWKYVGEAYRKGKLTKYGELASKDREYYRLRTRYLLLFLDENNSPLHHIPRSIGTRSRNRRQYQ